MTKTRVIHSACLMFPMRLALALFVGLAPAALHAQETVCARVKIEIKREVTLERQGFEAEMKINNTTDTGVIENVGVVVRVTDENGTPVAITDNPNDLSAKFFVRLSRKDNIDNIDGSGVVKAKTGAAIEWLLVPAPGTAGNSALGKKYLVGATLKYKFGGDDSVLEVAPDVITVKPLPQLTLDYFLPSDVWADDPLTSEIEPTEPFTLGVRVKNNGFAIARNLKMDSAQPKIVENKQGMLINFILTGSYINDAPAENTLLINFGDIPGNSSKMGRWNMETMLAGRFVDFTARFTHADELGGALTSVLQAANAHVLVHDVRVDLPGRDQVRDFLARDGDVVRVYESDAADTEVTDRSGVATFSVPSGSSSYRLAFPATAGFAYARVPDPFEGSKVLGMIMRSDAKPLAPENVWLSKTRNEQTKGWDYWVNVFDVNTTGIYDSHFDQPSTDAQPPVMQFIPDRTVQEGKRISFLVGASSPARKPLALSAAPLPAGATFATEPAGSSALGTAVFGWTPAAGSAGSYPITFTASDGILSVRRTATIKVEAALAASAGPAIPAIESPLSGAVMVPAVPVLKVQTATQAADTAAKVQFELYADEAASEPVASALIDTPPAGVGANGAAVVPPAAWTPPEALGYGGRYWWRARTFDGKLYSPWAYARFTVESANAVPAVFNQTSPAPDALVASSTPVLAWTNSSAADGEPVTYSVAVAQDRDFANIVTQVSGLPEAPGGTTRWKVAPPLASGARYYWRVIALRAPAGQTSATPSAFTVDTANTPPADPVPVSPAAGAISTVTTPTLTIAASADAEHGLATYVFEIDSVNTFDSAAKHSSAQRNAAAGGISWSVPPLAENTRYWWRAKTRNGRAESAWVGSDFVVSASNDSPPVPGIRNPGNGAWTSSQQPSLEAMPVTDPEGDPVRYEFEVYKDSGMTQKAADGTSPNPALIVPVPLAATTWHWWRVRARDSMDAASAWSTPASLYVGNGVAQERSIAVTSPAMASVPVTTGSGAGARKLVTIRWEGLDPNRDASVALYYGTARSGFSGTLIAEGLRQGAGAQSGSYVWDVGALAPGVYYVHAVVFDSLGQGHAYAPGSVVIPNPIQSGTLKIKGPGILYEAGSGTVGLDIDGAVANPLRAPVFGNGYSVVPPQRQSNGETSIHVIYPYQCSKSVPAFANQVGPVIGEDLNFAGRVALGAIDELRFVASNTGDEALRVCEIRILSERRIDAAQSEFTVTARLSNLGAAFAAARVVPVANVPGVAVSGVLGFGAIGAGESGSASGVVSVRAPSGQAGIASILQRGLKWSVQLAR